MRLALPSICLLIFFAIPLPAQTHTSVNLSDQIYHILEQAEMRGLITPLSGVRPYTRNVVTRAINELLDSDRIRPIEREILEDHLARLNPRPQPGFDWRRGSFFAGGAVGRNEMPLTFNLDLGMDFEMSASVIPEFGETHTGTEVWVHVDFYGDIGRNFSWGFFNQGGIIRVPRRFLGMYWTYYEGFELPDHWNADEYENRHVRVYSEPLTHFPFSYRRRWDGSVFPLGDIGAGGFRWWPETTSGAYSLHAEMTASFLDDIVLLRLGRMRREWGSMPLGTSLIFSSAARPFLAMEAEFRPFHWVSFSSLLGSLEYENRYGIRESALRNQNNFSILMLQLRFRNYVFLDLFDAAVWPNRFELGYILPITSNFFTQNNVGYFDNMGIGLNLRLQYPGLGNAWFSLFVDEMSIERNMFQLARTMIAYQAGFNIPLPFLGFSSFRFSYTKTNPFVYTHMRNSTPWSGGLLVETAWHNNGASLGHYLPPNADEFLLQFRTMPTRNTIAVLQYQMIRRGANFGSNAVMGSDLRSELDPNDRSGNPRLRTFFLHDGAYQWMHVARASADWSLPNLPISLFGEAGIVFSYFTNIDEPANSGQANIFRRINTPEYPTSTSLIVRVGFRLFR